MTFPDSDEEAIADMAAELMRCERPITLVLRPESAFHLVALLQLAKRHPNVGVDARRVADTFIAHAREYFVDAGAPTVVEAIHRGDDPTFDRVRDEEPLVRLYHRTLGGHVHCRLFVRALGSSAQSGTLTFSLEEWPAIEDVFRRAPWLELIADESVM